jgi:hypothetical protein
MWRSTSLRQKEDALDATFYAMKVARTVFRAGRFSNALGRSFVETTETEGQSRKFCETPISSYFLTTEVRNSERLQLRLPFD